MSPLTTNFSHKFTQPSKRISYPVGNLCRYFPKLKTLPIHYIVIRYPQQMVQMVFCDLSHTFHNVTNVSQHVFVILLSEVLTSPLTWCITLYNSVFEINVGPSANGRWFFIRTDKFWENYIKIGPDDWQNFRYKHEKRGCRPWWLMAQTVSVDVYDQHCCGLMYIQQYFT